MSDQTPRLYSDLAKWWPLFSPPVHYVEEAADVLPTIMSAPDMPPRTLLELGCGGGSLASHLKAHIQLTLTDRSPDMLVVSRAVNPECEHVPGDMRTLNLGREFDAVMIHDAIMYLTEPESLRAAFATAHRHCRSGGAVVILPDCVTETLEPRTENGGEDGADGRALRWLEWVWDPNRDDHTFKAAYSFLFRDPDGRVTVDMDEHTLGVFSRAEWQQWLGDAGFDVTSRMDPWNRDVFICRKRERS
jgi:ubiquinone/menaquinone biosynthesis C-methylase UbiE